MVISELRIGNLLEQGKVKSLYYDGSVGLDSGFSHHIDALTPLNLTEEWLIKFGCQKSAGNDRYFLNHHWFCLSFDDRDWCLHQNPDTIVAISYCRYVHQLQNIYFSLTGEELTIKKTVPA